MKMKHSLWLILLAALMLPARLFAETSLGGYQGSRWKDTPAQVKAALIGKEYKVEEDGRVISYKDKLADENVKIKFVFEQNSLSKVTVDLLLPSSNVDEFLRVYRKFMARYTGEYGQPDRVIKKGVTDIDKDNLILLATGESYYLNIWEKGEGLLEMRIGQGDYGPGLRLTYMQAGQVQKKRSVTQTAAAVPDSGSAPSGPAGLTFGVRPTLYIMPKVDEFEITKEDRSESVSVDGKAIAGMSPYVQIEITPNLGMELAFDGFWGRDTRLLVGSASAVGTTEIGGGIKPYLKLGVCYGQFGWNSKGNFSGGLGLQLGGGVERKITEHWGVGLDITGRYLKNKFNAPDGWSAKDDNINLSGVAIGGEVFYQF